MLELFMQKENCFILVFLFGSLFGFSLAIVRRIGGTQITGEILSYRQNEHLHFIPIIQFEVEGVIQTLQLNRGFKKKLAKEGQMIEIYYKPDNEKSVRLIGDKRDIWCSSILLCLAFLSIILLII